MFNSILNNNCKKKKKEEEGERKTFSICYCKEKSYI